MQLREDIDFPPKDEGLREDVGDLGRLVGRVLQEQCGQEFFEFVEEVRREAIRRREEDGDEELQGLTADLEPERAAQLVRAFSLYFQVVNLAEAVHRIRRGREYLMPDDRRRVRWDEAAALEPSVPPQPDGIEDAFINLQGDGLGCEAVPGLIDRIRIEPVFTAHPTESTRRTILEKQHRIALRLVERLGPLTIPESRTCWERIRSEVTSIWQTGEHPSQRPSVRDEREHVLYYLTDVIYRIVPPFYESLERALERVYGIECSDGALPPLLRFASWVGGDMDGNPNVGADTIRASLAEHRALLLPLYRREISQLSRRLSQTVPDRVGASRQLWDRVEEYCRLFREESLALPERHRRMPYRILLRLMAVRLDATLDDKKQGYDDPQELISDLVLIADSLRSNKGVRAGLFNLIRLKRRVETFGFHLATLDVRQDAQVIRAALGDLMGDDQWESRTPRQRALRLDEAIQAERPFEPSPSRGAGLQALEVFRTIADCRKRYGRRSVGPFIISMTQGADDVLAVLLLSHWAGLKEDPGIHIAPLFETVPDLKAAPQIMRSLLRSRVYRRHLRGLEMRQTIMVGYSDSNKDGGLAASRWALQKAQAALAEALLAKGVGLTVFHGRGGTVSRGGGKTHRAVMAAPRIAVEGRLRMTEQGEAIDAKYGLQPIALRTLERAFSAVVRSAASTPRPTPGNFEPMMEELARLSRLAYRELIYSHPGFYEYFRKATPIDLIERMPIGSRPASRRARTGIEDLRAIPWVFSWTQSRHLIPGWYGLGTALEQTAQKGGQESLLRMAAEWEFFGLLLDDAETMLAVSDMDIASRYAELAGDAGRAVFDRIEDEYRRTVDALLRLKGYSVLLEENATLRRAIRLRNPYVDPMSLLQIDLLKRWRAAGRPEDATFRALLATVNGIARGLQSTG